MIRIGLFQYLRSDRYRLRLWMNGQHVYTLKNLSMGRDGEYIARVLTPMRRSKWNKHMIMLWLFEVKLC
jgi:hypothetical protein